MWRLMIYWEEGFSLRRSGPISCLDNQVCRPMTGRKWSWMQGGSYSTKVPRGASVSWDHDSFKIFKPEVGAIKGKRPMMSTMWMRLKKFITLGLRRTGMGWRGHSTDSTGRKWWRCTFRAGFRGADFTDLPRLARVIGLFQHISRSSRPPERQSPIKRILACSRISYQRKRTWRGKKGAIDFWDSGIQFWLLAKAQKLGREDCQFNMPKMWAARTLAPRMSAQCRCFQGQEQLYWTGRDSLWGGDCLDGGPGCSWRSTRRCRLDPRGALGRTGSNFEGKFLFLRSNTKSFWGTWESWEEWVCEDLLLFQCWGSWMEGDSGFSTKTHLKTCAML